MIPADWLLNELVKRGIGLLTGVPCSFLAPLINAAMAIRTIPYVAATNEGDAVAIAAGSELGGIPAVAMFQNSGLGNAVSPLTSLTGVFQIPVLLFVTWRGQPGAPADEPQHRLMGPATPGMLELMGIRSELLPGEPRAVEAALDRALEAMRTSRVPYAFIVARETLEPRPVPESTTLASAIVFSNPNGASRNGSASFHPDVVLGVVQRNVRPTDAVIATTGFTGRALWALADRPSQFYMVGSMGCASSLGLGLALARPDRRVVVVDGDGALLMRLGALATIGRETPPNLLHIVLDNGVHDSTGAQATGSELVDLPAIARACGYRRVFSSPGLDELARLVSQPAAGLGFVHVRTFPRPDRQLPRPTMGPPEVAARFRQWLGAN